MQRHTQTERKQMYLTCVWFLLSPQVLSFHIKTIPSELVKEMNLLPLSPDLKADEVKCQEAFKKTFDKQVGCVF